MKISDLPIDRALDVFIICTRNITNILTDEKLMESIKSEIPREKIKSYTDFIRLGAEKINIIVPMLFGTHREDMYTIVSTVNGINLEDFRSMRTGDIYNLIKELLSDEESINFFASFAGMGKSA